MSVSHARIYFRSVFSLNTRGVVLVSGGRVRPFATINELLIARKYRVTWRFPRKTKRPTTISTKAAYFVFIILARFFVRFLLFLSPLYNITYIYKYTRTRVYVCTYYGPCVCNTVGRQRFIAVTHRGRAPFYHYRARSFRTVFIFIIFSTFLSLLLPPSHSLVAVHIIVRVSLGRVRPRVREKPLRVSRRWSPHSAPTTRLTVIYRGPIVPNVLGNRSKCSATGRAVTDIHG